MDEHARFRRSLLVRGTGLATEDEARWATAHATSCTACRELAAAYEADIVAESGDRHLPDAMIAAWPRARLVLGGLERDAVAHHLGRCDTCRADLEALGYDPTVPEAAGPARAQTSWRQAVREHLDRLAALVIPAPLPVRVTRGGSTDPRTVVRRYALDAYARGDYHSAESLFRQALVGAEDDAETLLYYASTLRLIGRESSAIAALEAARGTMPTARVDAEVAWQLANAYLAVGREEDAAVLLDTLSDSTSHGTRATDLLRELDA